MNGIRITLFVLIAMHILPFVITQLLIAEYPFDQRKHGKLAKWVCTAANVLLNALVLYEILKHSKFDLAEIINFTCTYQDISRLATSNVISLALSFLIGLGLYICARELYRDGRVWPFSNKRLLLFSLAAVPIVLGYYFSYSGVSDLAIDEVCRKTTAEAAELSRYPGQKDDDVCYVSVINNGILAYELDEMYLSADIDDLREQQFLQGAKVKPGETYQYVFSENILDIKKTGETVVYLSDKFGNIADNIIVPALKRDESYKNMGTDWQIVSFAKEVVTVPAPSFSREGGFYDEPFMLELTADPETTIYYTLDSSSPTTESLVYSRSIYVYDRSNQANRYPEYTGERLVDKCYVVRAVAVDSAGNISDIVTKSYFIGQDKYKDRTVISLVSDPDGLFGDDGIYVTGKAYDEWYLNALANLAEGEELDTTDAPTKNYNQRGIEWERESSFEVFENAEPLLSQQVGIRIQGNAYRAAPLKRFSIYARKAYSSSSYFDVDLINDFSQHSLYLRPGQAGNLHVICEMIGKGRNVATMDFIQASVFVDGEFWYTTYLYEKFSEKNLAQKYGLDPDNVVTYRPWKTSDGSEALGKNPASSLWSFISSHNMANDDNYFAYNEILDIQSYIDWYAINTFLYNSDCSEHANTAYWHTVIPENGQEGDAKWRLGLYDMDVGGWSQSQRMYGDIPYYEANPFTSWFADFQIYSALKSNKNFCKQFVLSFMDMINTNLSTENTTAIMDSLGIANAVYQEFFENRPVYMVSYVAGEFGLTGTQETVTLSSNVSGAPITLNTITPELRLPAADDGAEETAALGTYSWTGSYFTDYPVTVTANDANFSHWVVTANGRTQTYTDRTIEVPVSTGGVQIYAISK